MYPFFPLNLNIVKCLQNKKQKPRKKKKKKASKQKLMQATKGKELMTTSLVFTHVGNSTWVWTMPH
jgi:hypothetical protein